MIRNSRRVTALAIAGAITLASAVTGCGAGTNPETARPTQLTEGVNVSRADLDVQIRNMFVLGPSEGKTLPAGGSAPVYATLISSATDGRPDKLVAVSSNMSGTPTPLPGGGLALPPGQAVSLNSPTGPRAVLAGLTTALRGGENIEVALQFERAGVVKATLPVVPQSGDFQTYGPAPTPVASPTATSPSASPKATASAASK
ncbi:MAG: periplasmic copper chaperone, partial [Streptosporangiaceae bacterium]|nr:periplasmic copper chaperone [Streptosporangiaceae bacterium]